MSDAGTEAREQANEYKSPFADRKLVFDDDTFMVLPPHPNLRMLDDEALEALEAYEEEIETYDKDDDGQVKNLMAGGPFFKDGKRVSPPYRVRMVQIAIGEDRYEELRTKTINGQKCGARDVWRAWSDQGVEIVERINQDSKSDAGSVVLEDVSPSDSK